VVVVVVAAAAVAVVVVVVVVVVILVAALLEGVLDESLVEMIFSVKDEGEVEVVVAAGVKAVE